MKLLPDKNMIIALSIAMIPPVALCFDTYQQKLADKALDYKIPYYKKMGLWGENNKDAFKHRNGLSEYEFYKLAIDLLHEIDRQVWGFFRLFRWKSDSILEFLKRERDVQVFGYYH